ncbi:unnamed protein product [Plasmodium vivax]|uniref:Uncharacterized protein n=5 Tax=Plasmodium vivax TaxID=5855 RepID=A5JZW4_PLAVS|nr:hypothetical protein, conserved [Plasmodium vivax]KMZ78075.1 hypothetical protein PVIIG_00762 [Plasmodium vivax India VII]KMZ90195.1 hypothetical protein PVMG_01562 [Plasmodium vivax Mauritania I]KMZ96905.1 hypothetical protein PVNG_01729 [Plasmodium vivax North Korean]EDL47525.1 hypothetical protein, conserved [Plasmodium vivax]CAG9472224.1 unnamed protein product [Plasmodium vivax]|eukprot:XP_001617252.1 hypothetical protein [Plasmodium vivax Sal-1]
MEGESKVKDDESKEEQTRIYKILLLTYARRLSKYQDQIKNIYFHNNIISAIKDETGDYYLSENVSSQHYFIDTLIKSNENQGFLKSIQLIESKGDKGEHKVSGEPSGEAPSGNAESSNNGSNGSNGTNGSNGSNNNAEGNNEGVNNEASGTNQTNQRTHFNNYIMDIMERFHLFLLLKILFVLFLFEASSKMYFIVSGLFILYNRGFFDLLISNFNFMSSNESIEQVLRRMSESRNLNNTLVSEHTAQMGNLDEGAHPISQQEGGIVDENNSHHLTCGLQFMHNERDAEEELDNGAVAQGEENSTDNKTNKREEASSSGLHPMNSINDEAAPVHAAWNEGDPADAEDNEFVSDLYDEFNYQLNDDNSKEAHQSGNNGSAKCGEKDKKKSFPFFKKKKIDQTTHGTELNVKSNSYEEFNSSVNLNEKGDSSYLDDVTDELFREMGAANSGDVNSVDAGNLLCAGVRRRKNVSSADQKGGNNDDLNCDSSNARNDSPSNTRNNNKMYFHDSSTTFNNLLNNSMSEFVNSDCDDSENNIDSGQSYCSNSSASKKKKDAPQSTPEEGDNNTSMNARRKPTKFEKYIYQSVVMFFMTLLPWWVPDVAYLED